MAAALQPLLGLEILDRDTYNQFVFLVTLFVAVIFILVIGTVIVGLREKRRRRPSPASAYVAPDIEPSVMRVLNEVSPDLQAAPLEGSTDQSPE